MAGSLADRAHRALLLVWRYLPLWARRIAVRILYPTFPVGAVAIIRDDRGRVLLLRQTYHRYEQWAPPGGWTGPGETPRRAAARETFEEIGLRVSVGRLLGVTCGPYGDVSLAFECRPLDGRAPDFEGSDEIDRAAYFPTDRLPPLPDATRALVEEAIATQAAWPGPPAEVGYRGHGGHRDEE